MPEIDKIKFLSAVKSFVFDSDGRLLCLYRSSTHPTHPHYPDLPGGLVDQGEDALLALQREIMEECGLDIDNTQTKLVFAHTEHSEKFKGASITRMFFVVRLKSKSPNLTLSYEHDNAEWLSPNDFIDKGFEDFIKPALEFAKDIGIIEINN